MNVLSELLCLNEGQVTRLAQQPGDSIRALDLALVSPSLASKCSRQVLGYYGSDYLPCSILVKKQKPIHPEPAPAAFTYNKGGGDTICRIRREKLQTPINVNRRLPATMVDRRGRNNMANCKSSKHMPESKGGNQRQITLLGIVLKHDMEEEMSHFKSYASIAKWAVRTLVV